MQHKHLIVGIFFTLALIPSIVNAQTSTTAPPSPAPSKTPTSILTLTPQPTEETPPNTTSGTTSTQQSFTQQDLSVLTGNVQRPNGITWHNGKLYTGCNGDWTIYELDDTTGATKTYIYGVKNTHTLYVEDAANNEINLWIPDFETNTLLRVNRNGAPVTIASNLSGPWGIVYLDPDHFLVTNLLGNTVSMLNRAGQVQEVVTGLRSPTGIAADNNFVYIANNGSARRAIEWLRKSDLTNRLTPDNDKLTLPLVSGVQNATGLVLGPDGYLYFAYSLGTRGVVGRVNPEICRENNGCNSDQVEIVLYTELAAPLAGLAISPDMRLYVHTIFRPEIYWVQLKDNTTS